MQGLAIHMVYCEWYPNLHWTVMLKSTGLNKPGFGGSQLHLLILSFAGLILLGTGLASKGSKTIWNATSR